METTKLIIKLFVVMGVISATLLFIGISTGSDIGELIQVVGIIFVVTSLLAFRVFKTSVKRKIK